MVKELRIAVVFGGTSPEHDVSIVSALQVLQALDSQRFVGIPVYVAPDGAWLAGKQLLDERFYVPNAVQRNALQSILPPSRAPGGQASFRPAETGLFRNGREVAFDVALLAFHGGAGENGQLQGLLDVAGVPYTGMRHMGSAVAMDKVATKRLLASAGVNTLPFVELRRPGNGRFLPRQMLDDAVAQIGLPCIVKPSHLGSSIGVSVVQSADDLEAALPAIFKLDSAALVERLVPNLVEYNLAMATSGDGVITSAIESPRSGGELLDFRKKYLSGATGSFKKLGSTNNSGLISMTRAINPVLPPEMEHAIRHQAALAFQVLGGTGAPRADFLCDSQTGEVWLNEINPCPGSFAYFLWAAASPPMLFTALLSRLIDEALSCHRLAAGQDNDVPPEARLFKRL